MRTTTLAASLLLFSFSALAQQTGGAALPPFQAKRLPPEKSVPSDTGELPANPNPLQLLPAATQMQNLSGVSAPLISSQRLTFP